MGQALEWIDAGELSESPEIESRNRFARENAPRDPSAVVQKYTGLTIEEIKEFLGYLLKELDIKLEGVGVELGAGVGGVSNALLSLFPAIDRIYAIEIVPEVVRLLQSKVTRQEGNEHRLKPIIGSFDDIRLPDASVDFIVEWDALHHSNNLERTLQEAARILKSGGVLIAFDRMHPNALSEMQREHMLNMEYSRSFKEEYSMPLEGALTRGQNGEHEIRESEWRTAFARAGLKLEQCVVFYRKCLRGLVYALLSQIPFSIRLKFNFYPMLVRLPARVFLLYALPFMPMVWRKYYCLLPYSFSGPRALMSQTAFVVRKP